MPAFDAIVLGTGGVGSAALYHLARRGLRVLGLDNFQPGHSFGSSHGLTRIIRQAYFEHPDYVPLVREAYGMWRELEAEVNDELLSITGLIEIGPPDGVLLTGVRRAAELHGLELEEVSRDDFARRFPGFVLPESNECVLEPTAGILAVERCVQGHFVAARWQGAEWREERVLSWQAEGSGFRIQTDVQEHTCERLVVAAGAWSAAVLADLGLPLRVVRKHLHWYGGEEAEYRRGGPLLVYETPAGYYYGFPPDKHGLKVAEHSGGEAVRDPSELDRAVDPAERSRVEAFLAEHLPRVGREVVRHDVCMYTLSPDEHFIVDRHPAHPRLAFAAGLSGHGLKFTPVLGAALADLAIDGHTSRPIEFLGLSRFR